MNDYVADYAATLYARNLSPRTVGEYSNDLTLFFTFLGHDAPERVTEADIYRYMAHLTRVRGVSAYAVSRQLTSIRGFFAYALKRRLVAENPAIDIKKPKIPATLPKVLPLDQAAQLLDAVDKASDYYERDHCILTLFLNCGIRLSELVGIDLADIDADRHKMTVTGKGRKTRVIYLNAACRDALAKYLAVRKSDNPALFVSRLDRRMHNQTVHAVVKKTTERAGLHGVSAHKLRHTAATLLYEQGVDIRTLKEILGHEQLNTTQIYTHVSSKMMAQAMECNPLSTPPGTEGSKK